MAADFIGTVLNIAINIAKGPLGWIKLGIRLIKKMAGKLFGDGKFSFGQLNT